MLSTGSRPPRQPASTVGMSLTDLPKHFLSSHRDRVGCHRYNLVDEAVDLSDGVAVLFHQQHQGN